VIAIVKAIWQISLVRSSIKWDSTVMEVYMEIKDAIAICQSRGMWGARPTRVSISQESGNAVAVASDGGQGGMCGTVNDALMMRRDDEGTSCCRWRALGSYHSLNSTSNPDIGPVSTHIW
jgi:hypothetical protein